MGFRFYKRVPLVPGLRANFSRSGASLSIGHRGGWFTVGSHGARATAGIPGTGLFYSTRVGHHGTGPHAGHQGSFILTVLIFMFLVVALTR
jgi:Protein of unknown function (DUF4236)